MKEVNIEGLLEEILPTMLNYSTYVQAIQRYTKLELKGDAAENPVARAFTHADIMYQEGVARGLLEIMKETGWEFQFAPEEESPYNTLFPTNGKYRIGLDPIDGSLVFVNGFSTYCHAFSVYEEGYLKGALVHTPIDKITYVALAEKEHAELWTPQSGVIHKEQFTLPQTTNPIAISMNIPDETAEELRRHGVNLMLFGTSSMQPDLEMNGVYRGEIGSFFKQTAAGIDWGALGFIIEKAGGRVSDFSGNKVDHKYWERDDGTPEGSIPSIIVSNNPRLHETLVEVLTPNYRQ